LCPGGLCIDAISQINTSHHTMLPQSLEENKNFKV